MPTLNQYEEHDQASMYDTSRPLKRGGTPFERDDIQTSKRTRGRTGCLNCRRRRKKCDEAKPDCSKCLSRGEGCEWDTGITFRLTGLDSQHPSMLQAKRPKSVVNQNGLRIVDVHFDNKTSSTPSNKAASNHGLQPSSIPRSQAKSSSQSDASNCNSGHGRPSTDTFCGDPNENSTLCTIPEESLSDSMDSKMTCDTSSVPKCQRFPMEQANPVDVVSDNEANAVIIETTLDGDEEMPDYLRSNSDGSGSMPSLPWSTALSSSSVTSVSSRASKTYQGRHDSDSDGLTHLNSLDCLMHDGSYHSLHRSASGDTDTPTALDKAKQKLHSQILNLVDKLSLAHQTSSDTDAEESAAALQDLKLNGEKSLKGIRLVHTPLVARPMGCTKLLKRRQLELWRNFIDNIAPCLDVCSNKRHFQHSLPMLAKSASHLHYAALALSARHLENQEPNSSFSESRGLQQDAINLLLAELHTLDAATIATCVILCVMELFSSPSSQCNSSLRTCAALMETADINARSGGFREAVFWCFANLAVWHSLSHPEQPAVLPTRSFYPSESLAETVNYIRSLSVGDGYAKYAVFLTFTILNTNSHTNSDSKLKQVRSQAQHSALIDLLSDWSNCRPEDMQPLMSYPSILDDEHHPFPMVLYPTVSATMGNLLYHCASILLLQNAPVISNTECPANDNKNSNEASKTQMSNGTTKCSLPETPTGKGITWHARQICGTLSETHEPAVLIHGRHALDIAAKTMSHSSEKEAILALLNRSERSTGWKIMR